jgi:hypothetical protein
VSGADEAGLAPRLLAFLAEDDAVPVGDEAGDLSGARKPIAAQRLCVEMDRRAAARSRLVTEGGVLFLRAEICAADDGGDPPAGRKRSADGPRLKAVKFRFTVTELPPSHSYIEVRVRIMLDPRLPVLLLRPHQEFAEQQFGSEFSTEFAPTIGGLVRMEMRRSRSESTSRVERRPVVTPLDLGPDGFGWTYQAQDGAPLSPRTEATIAVLEVPSDATALTGVFDADAIITRRVLRTVERRRALPSEPPAPFSVDLGTAGDQTGAG